jgi:hypothetical protein
MKTQYPPNYWPQMISKWEQSGLNQRDFCAQENIIIHQFQYYRLKSLKKSEKFKKITIVEEPISKDELSESLIITFPSGAKLEIAALTINDLKELLS